MRQLMPLARHRITSPDAGSFIAALFAKRRKCGARRISRKGRLIFTGPGDTSLRFISGGPRISVGRPARADFMAPRALRTRQSALDRIAICRMMRRRLSMPLTCRSRPPSGEGAVPKTGIVDGSAVGQICRRRVKRLRVGRFGILVRRLPQATDWRGAGV